jgi:hypothetical protein
MKTQQKDEVVKIDKLLMKSLRKRKQETGVSLRWMISQAIIRYLHEEQNKS